MTISDEGWTAAAWAARLASGNPVYPYEWSVHYASGRIFPRVCQGRVRTSRDAPLAGITALRVWRPGLALELPAPDVPIGALVLRVTVRGVLGRAGSLGVARWIFGFETAAGFEGLWLDPTGQVTQHVRPERRPA